MDIWSTQIAWRGGDGRIGAKAENIAAIGITNQRETVIVWEKETGRPVCNAIVWQCRRTAPMIDSLKNEDLTGCCWKRQD